MKLKLESNNTEEKEEEKKDSNSKNREQMRKRLLLVFGAILGVIILILLILFVVSLIFGKKPSYREIEEIMKNAAIEYYSNHKARLPQNNDVVEAVDDDILVRNEYMKPLNKYLKEGVNCLGKVEVDYNNGDYIYTPYLECGKAYSTVELYKKATDSKNIVTSGYGLYNMNNEFVYRGENVNNYITLDGQTDEASLWRIVKFTKEGEAVLIGNRISSVTWDDRFNTVTNIRDGINEYSISRIKETLNDLYWETDEKKAIFSKKAREKLVTFNLCSGKRAQNYAANDNSAECSSVIENQRMGLLTLSDFLNVSTDPNCNNIYARACQNYNYLKVDYHWWLVTALPENTKNVYRIKAENYVEKSTAAYNSYIRPVVHLSSKAMYSGGNGTLEKPYRFR